MIRLATGPVAEVALIGAHCDDIAIGMGATLLTLARRQPRLRVRALVLCGAGTERENEEWAALEAFCPGAHLELTVLDLPDGRTPAQWDRVKRALNTFRRQTNPDLVYAPQPRDAHQDHRLLAELTPTEFRDHLILGYEILKWETDTPTPTLYQPITEEVAEEKARLLLKHYPSQVDRDWFDAQTFLGLTRVRGVQCRAPHAEAFVVAKVSVEFGG
ncbi:PIG-L family deacetylase [Nocardia panacis]|uniref:PIG-L family deacetylase n=1 Tax=Nocardia panacis TaxID=2340916 RepID=A0A3A4K1B8_9NOCA|nr:PIG-L family deacetylase [Nocardia panacis]RJO73510.1 PIG-L family deacetylase [Nocardia panacis]